MALNLSSSMLNEEAEDDFDPMSSIANLVDVMLVFACGLMMALVVSWNVDITQFSQVTPTEKLTEVSNIEELQEELTAQNGSSYVDMGTVWMDPSTGKYYMVLSDEEAEAARAAAGQTQAATAGTEAQSAEGAGATTAGGSS